MKNICPFIYSGVFDALLDVWKRSLKSFMIPLVTKMKVHVITSFCCISLASNTDVSETEGIL